MSNIFKYESKLYKRKLLTVKEKNFTSKPLENLFYYLFIDNKHIFQKLPVPASDSLNLFSLTFDDFSLNDDEMLLAAVSMFLELGLVKTFNIEKEVSV